MRKPESNFISKRKQILCFLSLIILLSSTLIGQEKGKGTIYIYSTPKAIDVKIDKLDFKEKKSEYGELILYNVPEDRYSFNFSTLGRKLTGEFDLPAGDTLAIFVNFMNKKVLANTTKNLQNTALDLEMRKRILRSFKAAGDSSFIQVTRDDGIAVSGLEKYGQKDYNEKLDGIVVKFEEDKMEGVQPEDAEGTLYIVEDMPLFNGGDPAIEFRRFIASNLRFPEEAAEKGVTGRVIVQFAIDTTGRLVDAEVVARVDPFLDQEALRVVTSSPLWTPGKQRDKPVEVLFTFPVNFTLLNPMGEKADGTILLYSKPAEVRISIKELKFKDKKEGVDPILIRDVPEGIYTFTYKMEGYKLEESYFLPAYDTLTVLADFYQMGVVSVLSKELNRMAKEKNENPILEKPILLNSVRVATFSVLRDSRSPGPPDLNKIPKSIANKIKSDSYQHLDSLTAESVGLDELPLFNGQNPDKFREFLAKTARFPNDAALSGELGRVEVQFSVDINGNVVDAIVVNDVSHASFGQEALRVVRLSPPWEPGIYNGEQVKVMFTVHFDFEDLGTINLR